MWFRGQAEQTGLPGSAADPGGQIVQEEPPGRGAYVLFGQGRHPRGSRPRRLGSKVPTGHTAQCRLFPMRTVPATHGVQTSAPAASAWVLGGQGVQVWNGPAVDLNLPGGHAVQGSVRCCES
jgi:hypothetical protein